MRIRSTNLVVSMATLLVVSACGSVGATVTTDPTTAPTTTSVPETTTSMVPATNAPAEFPPGRENLEHGGYTWVVVLAAATDFDDPVLAAAVAAADDAGYTTGPTDCDAGAAEAVNAPQGSYTVSVYLNSEADAQAAALAFADRNVTGTVAEVQTFCLD